MGLKNFVSLWARVVAYMFELFSALFYGFVVAFNIAVGKGVEWLNIALLAVTAVYVLALSVNMLFQNARERAGLIRTVYVVVKRLFSLSSATIAVYMTVLAVINGSSESAIFAAVAVLLLAFKILRLVLFIKKQKKRSRKKREARLGKTVLPSGSEPPAEPAEGVLSAALSEEFDDFPDGESEETFIGASGAAGEASEVPAAIEKADEGFLENSALIEKADGDLLETPAAIGEEGASSAPVVFGIVEAAEDSRGGDRSLWDEQAVAQESLTSGESALADSGKGRNRRFFRRFSGRKK